MKKVSVIVPIYNAAEYLHKCICSILTQTYKKLEIILIDDGSCDASGAICDEYALEDKRVSVIHRENRGLVATRKEGMSVATGEYISFVDADDYIDCDMYEKIMSQMSFDNPDVIAFGMKEIYSNRQIIKKNSIFCGIYNREAVKKEILPHMISQGDFFGFGMLPNMVCKLFKREFISQSYLEVSDDVTVGEDADFSFQLMAQAELLQIIDFCPYNYVKNTASMMWKPLDISAICSLEKDLKNCFAKIGITDIMEHQIVEYITFVKLLKCPEKVYFIDNFFSRNEKIAIYGAGGFGQALYGRYKEKIVCIADRDYAEYQKRGIGVISVEEMKEKNDIWDVLFISILDTFLCKSIEDSLRQQGIVGDISYFSI